MDELESWRLENRLAGEVSERDRCGLGERSEAEGVCDRVDCDGVGEEGCDGGIGRIDAFSSAPPGVLLRRSRPVARESHSSLLPPVLPHLTLPSSPNISSTILLLAAGLRLELTLRPERTLGERDRVRKDTLRSPRPLALAHADADEDMMLPLYMWIGIDG